MGQWEQNCSAPIFFDLSSVVSSLCFCYALYLKFGLLSFIDNDGLFSGAVVAIKNFSADVNNLSSRAIFCKRFFVNNVF